jgi:hypothetical protein
MTTPTPARPIAPTHCIRDFLVVCCAVVAAECAGRVVLGIAGPGMSALVAVIAFIIGTGAGAAWLTLTAPHPNP